MSPLPQCQFIYNDGAQCMWVGATEEKQYCSVHGITMKGRARTKRTTERNRLKEWYE